jgi:hypothetical protein
VPRVANVSGLFILDCFLGFLYRLFVLLRPVSCVPRVANVSGLFIPGCSSVFSTVYLFVFAAHKTQDEDKQINVEKTEEQTRMDNPETLATLGTQDTGQRQTNKR